jgi:ATP-dependent RNA helicase DHX29
MIQEEEEEDIHEQYAETKLKLLEIEKLVPSNNNTNKKTNGGKKNKKKSAVEEEEAPIVLTDEELTKARKDIKKLKERLASLEADWDFDKTKAEEIYTKELQIIADEKGKQQAEARILLRKKQQEEQVDTPVEKEQEDDDEEGGLFGGLMMDEEEAAAMESTPAASTHVQWTIVDLSVPKPYVGKYPKSTLLDHCNKQNLGKQSFNSSSVGSGIWRSSLKITKEGYSTVPLRFELPEELGTSNRHDAEQLVAVSIIFNAIFCHRARIHILLCI